MQAIQNAITRARLRLFLCRSVRSLGWLALIGLAAATGMLLVDRLLLAPGWVVPWWAYAVVAGVVAGLAPVLAWRGLPSREATAELLDERLHLKDRLSTALYVRSMGEAPFTRQVIDDAEQAASRLSVREALPVQPGRPWGWAPVGAAVLGLLALLVPAEVDLLGTQDRQARQAAEDEHADEAQRRLVEARAHMPDPSRLTDEAEAARAEDLLNQLAELSQRDLRNPDVRREAQAQLSRLQDRIVSEREQQERALRTLRNAMSRIDPERSGPADRFSDALRRGEFETAQRELEELARSVRNGELSESEKQALQQQMRNMSEQLDQMAEQHRQREQQTQEQMREQLREQGLSDEQVDQLQERGYDQESVEEAVREQSEQREPDEEQAQQQAREQAEQTRRQQQQSQQDRTASEMGENLSRSMGQMADSLEPDGQPDEQEQQPPQDQAGQEDQQARPQQEQQAQPTQEGQPPQQAQQGQQEQQGQEGQQAQQDEAGRQDQGFDQGAWEGQQQLDRISQMEQALQEMGASEQQVQEAMQQLSGQQARQDEAPDAPGQAPQPEQPQQAADSGTGPGAGEGAGDAPQGEPRQIESYEARARNRAGEGQGRIISSWDQQGEMTAGPPTVEFDEAVSEARSDAERAVSEDRVPRRYHGAIREYFKQLPESAEQTRRAPAAPQ